MRLLKVKLTAGANRLVLVKASWTCFIHHWTNIGMTTWM